MITKPSPDHLYSLPIAFPLRLQQAQLQKTDARESYLTLLWIMARTPCGSWPGDQHFGFREFFHDVLKDGLSEEQRTRLIDTTVKNINTVMVGLDLRDYCVDSLALEGPPKELQGFERARWLNQSMEAYGVTLTVRERSSDRAYGYSL
ncbi:hypothetical protein [Granulicella sp. S190]|uniref:hypothetical protein n=1 Tax=Granulicella sp. S190 TaxID=1747226 RepID=UPI00131B131C|nr:hypothetical protein [Granulicella sp. S190]